MCLSSALIRKYHCCDWKCTRLTTIAYLQQLDISSTSLMQILRKNVTMKPLFTPSFLSYIFDITMFVGSMDFYYYIYNSYWSSGFRIYKIFCSSYRGYPKQMLSIFLPCALWITPNFQMSSSIEIIFDPEELNPIKYCKPSFGRGGWILPKSHLLLH